MSAAPPPVKPGRKDRGHQQRSSEPPRGDVRTGRAMPEGRAARDAVVEALHGVLAQGRSFDDLLSKACDKRELPPRDRAFARAVSAAALRHCGSLRHIIAQFLQRPLPNETGRLNAILLSAAAQLVILKTPPHAAISIAVDQTRADPRARRFDKLANAILRRVSEKGEAILNGLERVRLDIPSWRYARWEAAYGPQAAHAIAAGSLREAPLDITAKSDPEIWAERLGGQLLPTGSIRLLGGGRVEELPGFAEGAWWVQDAAAALPVKLLGDVRGLSIADVCAAPGGKTAQLAALGAHVTAVDISDERLNRLKQNLARLHLPAETIVADATQWSPPQLFDAILLDAPCTATGTIRRHPDILHLKRAEDAAQLAGVQKAMLEAAAKSVKPGGRIVYCTCSLEPEEGPEQVAGFLAQHADFSRQPVDPARVGGWNEVIGAEGDLRTLPHHLSHLGDGQQGLDGFYASVLIKAG